MVSGTQKLLLLSKMQGGMVSVRHGHLQPCSVVYKGNKLSHPRHDSLKWPEALKALSLDVGITMFVQDIKTFSVLHDCWLTVLSHPFDFLTTWSTFLSSIQISTFFYCRCVMFAVGGDPILRVQKYHDIKTVVMQLSDVTAWLGWLMAWLRHLAVQKWL